MRTHRISGPDDPGKQTVSSFFIDTQEFSTNPLDGNKNMLWLAGKYGGFIDSDNNDQPNLQAEWDGDSDGVPDNYVLASVPDKLVTGSERGVPRHLRTHRLGELGRYQYHVLAGEQRALSSQVQHRRLERAIPVRTRQSGRLARGCAVGRCRSTAERSATRARS